MILFTQTVLVETGAMFVGVAAVCRLSQMHVIKYEGKAHSPGWVAAYLAMAIGSVVAFFEAASHDASWSTLLLLAACGGWLWLSRVSWKEGAPKYLERIK